MVYDFCDTKFYKKDFLNIFMFTDGMQISKNPVRSIWPIFVSLVELPPAIRESKKNKIIYGVWHGETKPTTDQLFDDFVLKMLSLRTNGVELVFNKIRTRVYFNFYGFNADLPAKAMILNMKGHAGFYCCQFCTIRGEYTQDFNKTIFPSKNIIKRTSESYEMCLRNGSVNMPCYGIKGNFALARILDLPKSIMIDYMHLVFEGICKFLANKWFNSKNKKMPYYIGKINL
jgi:hypothetical protein